MGMTHFTVMPILGLDKKKGEICWLMRGGWSFLHIPMEQALRCHRSLTLDIPELCGNHPERLPFLSECEDFINAFSSPAAEETDLFQRKADYLPQG
ncbi:hypothetical protein [Peribacillus sp. SI8-4]|uniref:hypothetical protein n=1 Tax=Peribacillus sp. SI8-4 TaxID=3048009 RepID=UPI0025541EA0|nr:hypothetical protein [Peribacillus sp. SI8-4]